MNEEVKRIVDILFEAYEENDELRAMREEVTENCCEHFADLVAQGLSREDALAAVLQSLKGMEEVLQKYPQAQTKAFDEKPQGQSACETVQEFGAADFQAIEIGTMSADVILKESPDGGLRLITDSSELMAGLRITTNGGKLAISQEAGDAKRDAAPESQFRVSMDLGNLQGMFREVGAYVKNMMKRASVLMADGTITLEIPQRLHAAVKACTVSGDVHLQRGGFDALAVRTTSGDVMLETDGEQDEVLCGGIEAYERSAEGMVNGHVEIATTSGDVGGFAASASDIVVRTISGDIHLSGMCRKKMQIHTTSGDVQIGCVCENCDIETVSGDVELNVQDACLRDLKLKTVSGDMDIELPEDLAMDMHGNARGKMVHKCANVTGRVNIQASSVSGETNIR